MATARSRSTSAGSAASSASRESIGEELRRAAADAGLRVHIAVAATSTAAILLAHGARRIDGGARAATKPRRSRHCRSIYSIGLSSLRGFTLRAPAQACAA